MDAAITRLFAAVLALVGPPPTDTPPEMTLSQGQKIVALGDSITAAGGYLRQMDAVLAQQYPELKLPPVLNKGISAQRSADLLGRFVRDAVEPRPAVLLIQVGLADVWQRLGQPHKDKALEDFTDNLERLIDRCQEAKIAPVLVSPTIIGEDPASEGNQRLARYAKAMQEVATKRNVRYADVHSAMRAALKHKPAGDDHWLTYDGAHLNARGNAVVAITILRALGVPDEKIAASEAPTWPLTTMPATRATTTSSP